MVLRLLPYDYLTGRQYEPDSIWMLNLDDEVSETLTGITSLSLDTGMVRRYTSYKYIKEAKDAATGRGGHKIKFRQIRPKDRLRENTDIQLQGWIDGPNATELAAQMNTYAKMPNLVVRMVTDHVKFYAGYMGVDVVDSVVLPDMDTDTDWLAGLMGSLSAGNANVDTDDFVQGTGSIEYVESTPTPSSNYSVRYNPTPNMSWTYMDPTPSEEYEYTHFWIKCNRGSDDLDWPIFALVDQSANSIWWSLAFQPKTWTEIELNWDDRTESPPANEGTINYAEWRFQQQAGDSTELHVNVDWLGVYMDSDTDGIDPVKFKKLEIPFFSIEGLQLQKRGGTGCRYSYTMRLKRIRDPPR